MTDDQNNALIKEVGADSNKAGMQFDEQYYVNAKTRAKEWLFQIPGVFGVALGPKIVAGRLTGDPAIQVFVQQKRSPHELAANEIIPREIDRIKTDVIEGTPPSGMAGGTQERCKTGKITAARVAAGSGSQTSPVEITSNGHGLSSGNRVRVFGVPLDTSAAFPVEVKGPDVFALPQDVNLVLQSPVRDFAFWSETCSWEDDLCCCPTGPITEATNTNPVKITSPSHGLQTGERIKIVRITGMTQIRGKEFVVGSVSKDKNGFELSGVDGSFFTMATHESGDWAKLCLDRTGPIQKISMGTPIQITSQGHPLKPGDRVHIISAAGIAEIKSWNKAQPFRVDTVSADTFTLKDVARAGNSEDRSIGSWIRIFPDTHQYSRIRGGIRVALERSEVVEPKSDKASGLVTTIRPHETVTVKEVLAFGTLGCLAIVDDGTKTKVLLSNYHVLYSVPDEDNIHHPDYSCCKSHKIAERMPLHAYQGKQGAPGTADAAMAKLDDPKKGDPLIVDIGPVKGRADITLKEILVDENDPNSDPRGYRVRKRGITTLLTEGIVVSLSADFQDATSTDPIVLKNQIKVEPMAGAFRGAFALKGDSGSAIVNDQNMVVALLCGGDESGSGYGSPIGEVETQLKVKVWAADSTTAGGGTDGDGSDVADNVVVTPSVPDLVAQLTEELVHTSEGTNFISLVQRHYDEVESLIHHNRRVTVAWHRNQGPSILLELYRFVVARDICLPDAVNGRLLRRCVENIRDALRRFGSARLAADIECHGPRILQLIGGSYSDLLLQLAARGGK